MRSEKPYWSKKWLGEEGMSEDSSKSAKDGAPCYGQALAHPDGNQGRGFNLAVLKSIRRMKPLDWSESAVPTCACVVQFSTLRSLSLKEFSGFWSV